MSMNRPSTVVGVFRDRSMAEQAMAALSDAGFSRDQIRYAGPGTSGGFFEDIKSLFTAPGTTVENLAHDLTGMGLSDNEARYYADEYNSGNTIIAVKAPGREQEAMEVLNRYGAYNYGPASTPGSAANPGYAPEPTQTYDQPPQANTPPRDYATPQPEPVGSDRTLTPDNQPVGVNRGMPDNQPIENNRAALSDQPTVTVNRSATATTGQNSELEQIQAQIQETRRQLEDARAQLKAAKDRESQLQSARQELQEVQAELQATLAELRDTQTRVGQSR
jgi:DNA-binding transcriptional MerR regulator